MEFDRDGAERAPNAISQAGRVRLEQLLADTGSGPGTRLVDRSALAHWLRDVDIDAGAEMRIGAGAKAVRAILFDKNSDVNWVLGWHQDRTITVRQRELVEGYSPWSVKSGIVHVEPPFSLIERMATARIHLDSVPPENAPLLILRGSHRCGKLSDDAVERLGQSSTHFVCLADAGDVWWYRTPIVHSSARFAGSGRRRVLQVDYSADVLPPPLEWRGIA